MFWFRNINIQLADYFSKYYWFLFLNEYKYTIVNNDVIKLFLSVWRCRRLFVFFFNFSPSFWLLLCSVVNFKWLMKVYLICFGILGFCDDTLLCWQILLGSFQYNSLFSQLSFYICNLHTFLSLWNPTILPCPNLTITPAHNLLTPVQFLYATLLALLIISFICLFSIQLTPHINQNLMKLFFSIL